MLFEEERVYDFVFAPFVVLWRETEPSNDNAVRASISKIALANAVIAALPGKLGVGVLVAMALEAYMAITIARRIGVKINRPSDIWKYVGLAAGVVGTILYLFRTLLNVTFAVFALVPALPATFLAELAVTNIVGVIFWVGFAEAKEHGSFAVPIRLFKTVYDKTRELSSYQAKVIGHAMSPANIRQVGERLWAFLSGDLINIYPPQIRGDAFAAAAMTYLLAGRYDDIQGPLGSIFIQSIRDRFSVLENATVPEIADHMKITYDADQIGGVLNVIKGKMFERMVELHENVDGDEWVAELHADESYPGSDIIFTNDTTGETVEVSLKATDDATYVEAALQRYPDIPIMVTSELSDEFEEMAMVSALGITNEELSEVTAANFDELVQNIAPIQNIDVAVAAGGAATVSGIAKLWPFAVAYVRGRITRDQMINAFECALSGPLRV